MLIPENEINFLVDAIKNKPEYLDPTFVKKTHQNQRVISDPFSKQVPDLIIDAIKKKKPYSVIRIGDGEANLLSYGSYLDTPILNLKAAKKIIAMQQDSFLPNSLELIKIKNRMLCSIDSADIIGIIGLWRPKKRNTNDLINAFLNDHRGISGHWRAIDYLIYLSKQDLLNKKILASAHLYFSILEHLGAILKVSKRILLITNRESTLQKFESYTSTTANVEQLLIGKSSKVDLRNSPEFLRTIKKQLPDNMSGYLCLIGAGPWSEIYCTWVKQRGGVAIDIGSGFDLLDGHTSRPIHKILGLDTQNRYTL